MIKILVISDITFDPILKEIYKQTDKYKITSLYFEDVNTAFYQGDFDEFDFIFFHSDLYFHIKEIDWQKKLINNLDSFCDKYSTKTIITSNLFNIGYKFGGRNLLYSKLEEYNFEFNHELEFLRNKSNLFFFDIKNLIFESGLNNSYNYVLGAMYQMPYTKELIIKFSSEFINFFSFLTSEEKKVIVIDCDNTLWNGVLGEDGINGIKCDKNYDGIVYYYFQKFLKEKMHEGFILCICSKNNEIEVEQLFKLDLFPLKWDDFLIKKVNWTEKSENIKQIAKELNIDSSAMIFIDDNPFELDSVLNFSNVEKAFLFKNDFGSLRLLINDYCFKHKFILDDDVDKNNQYRLEQERLSTYSNFTDLDSYISSLNLKLVVNENDLNSLERISQMTEKTNQFNFNKKPYSVNELRLWVNNGNKLFSAKLSDKYGEYGIIGLIMLERTGSNEFILENYLISCRALGKQIEDKFFNDVIEIVSKSQNLITSISFKSTQKNVPAQLFTNKLKQNGYQIREIK
jgi:FkbH-like protein